MEFYTKICRCQSLKDVFQQLILPVLIKEKTDKGRLKLLNLNASGERSFHIPSNERNNGTYYLEGLSIDGTVSFTKYKTGFMWSEKEGKTSRSLFTRDKDGDRLMNSHVNHYLIDKLTSTDFDIFSKYKNARNKEKKLFYLGLIIYKNLLEMNYIYLSGGSYSQLYPINFYTTRKDVHKYIEEDFELWKKTGTSLLHKDPRKDVYFSGVCADYVKSLLNDLQKCGYDDEKKMRTFAEKIVPFQDYFYIYDVFNKYNKAYWENWRKENKVVEKNLEKYKVIPFEQPV